MDKVAVVLGIVRHALTFGGGILVAFGLVTNTDWSTALTSFDGATGGAIALIGVVASIVNKAKVLNWKGLFTAPPSA